MSREHHVPYLLRSTLTSVLFYRNLLQCKFLNTLIFTLETCAWYSDRNYNISSNILHDQGVLSVHVTSAILNETISTVVSEGRDQTENSCGTDPAHLWYPNLHHIVCIFWRNLYCSILVNACLSIGFNKIYLLKHRFTNTSASCVLIEYTNIENSVTWKKYYVLEGMDPIVSAPYKA